MDSENRISRREMLRNIGIAGAVAWAAPVLSSLPAAEASVNKNLCKGQIGICSGNFTQCSAAANCGPFAQGFCFDKKGNENKTFCGSNDYCSNLTTCTGKCPKGYKCSYDNGCTSCTGSSSGVCIFVCKKASSPGRRPSRTPRKGVRTAAPHR